MSTNDFQDYPLLFVMTGTNIMITKWNWTSFLSPGWRSKILGLKPELSHNARFARRAIRHGQVPIGRPVVALINEVDKKNRGYLAVWGNYELH